MQTTTQFQKPKQGHLPLSQSNRKHKKVMVWLEVISNKSVATVRDSVSLKTTFWVAFEKLINRVYIHYRCTKKKKKKNTQYWAGQTRDVRRILKPVLPRRDLFYLLDYVTPTEIFQIGDRKKKRKVDMVK